MNSMIINEIRNCLQNSEFWTPKTKEGEKLISSLVCPICGDTTAWAYTEKPMSINCNKMNSCGARTRTIKLFNIITSVEKRFPSTSTTPNRPAEAYLRARGLNKTLDGLVYEYWSNVRECGRGAVMFKVAEQIYNGRLINPPPGEGKTHNQGSTSGKFWKHPNLKYYPDKPTYVTEGIIDALSLIEMGHQAIAILSAGQAPSKLDLSEFKNLTTAFDNDQAGIQATKNWRKHS